MKNYHKFLTKLGTFLILFSISMNLSAANETFTSGAYIIDMGQSSQTVAKGLKPYGLVYALISDHNVPVRWAINPSKVKDGTDFTVNSKAYKGGTFIIPAQYISTAVLAKINTWRSAGVVVDGPINVSFTAPVYKELTSWPRAILDEDNGKIVKDYYTNAGVPSSSYQLAGNPTQLTGCDDIYVLPHADPQDWPASWRTALDNYVKSGGYLWAACHAVSALEGTTYSNLQFLSSTGLVPWGSHNDGNGSYTYNPSYAADPIMQFMGTLDDATTNGSEQIYIPTKNTGSWRPTTKVAVYQPSHSQANQNEAAVVVYGNAYGNSNYGMVMYEAGHDHAKKTDPEYIAAQRAFFNFILLAGAEQQIDITTTIPTTVVSGGSINISASASGGSSPYTYQWSSSCAGGSFSNPTSANTTYTVPTVNSPIDCSITVLITDNCGRFSYASKTVVVTPPQTDLLIVKSVNNQTPNVGSNVSFTLTATNNGPSNATNVSVSDLLPTGYTYLSATQSTGVYNSGTGLWSIGNLNNGASATLTIVATVKSTGSYANTATITGTQTDPTPGNNTSTVTPVPVSVADLAVTKTVSNQTPNVGANVTFTITASNNGPSAATGVTVSDILPAGYTFVSASASAGTSWSAPNWTIGALANGGSTTLSIVATVNATGPYANTANISGNQTDPVSTNNSSTSTPVPVGVTDLSILKTVSNQTPNMGSNITFTLTATNNGPSNATGVSVNDVLPTGYTFVSATPSGSWAGSTWTIGNLANGANTTLTIVATVKASGSYANTATITGGQTDPTPGNNTSTSTPIPVPVADLGVTKTVNNQSPNVGSNVSFTITAINNGPSAATGVSVSDVLPAGYTFVSASPSGSWSGSTWTIGNLANGANATLIIVATVNASGSYENTATISGTQLDPVTGNNSSSVSTVPSGVADLAVTKTASSLTPNVGSNVSFTLTASNNGPSNATGVSVSDVLPAGYTFVSATPSGSWSGSTWTIGNLANGANTTLTIVATVNASGPYGNTATITGGQTDPISGNNTSTVTPVPVPVADLAIVKTASSLAPTVGSAITFTLTASNNGPSNATGVSVGDVLPAGYTFVSATPSGSWSGSTWTIGNLANGANTTLTIVATVNANGSYANTATISGIQSDPVGTNNSSTVTPVPSAQADLAVVKTINNQTPNVGTNVTFTIAVSNNGPSNATNVEVNDILPAGYTFVNATPSIGTWAAPTWTIGNLNNGVSASLTIIATVKASGPYLNTATVSGSETDPTMANNTSSVSPQIGTLADLAVVKTVNVQTPNVGTNVTFTITASNAGPSPATGVSVNDVLPAGYTFVSASASAGTSWAAPTWTIGNLANGNNAVLNIVATVNATGPYTNTAAITGNESDPNLDNNNSSITPQIGAIADLAVVKTVNIQNPKVGDNITFTILASNSGPSAATNVVVNDVLPVGYTLVGATPSAGTSWNSPNWSIGNLSNNGSATLTINAKVNATGSYANTATIDGTETDPNTANNSSTSTPVPGPDAINDNASTNLNTPVNINVITNDVPGAAALNPTTVTFVAGTIPNPTTVGVFTVNPTTGLVTFTPATGFVGTATVDYQVCDLNALCDIATITVVVNSVAGPTANDDNATTPLNTAVDINALANDVAGATPLNPTTLTFISGTAPNPTTVGTFAANPTTGLVTFTPVTGFTGTATIDYQVCDQNVLCDIATITVVVNSVAGPTANDDNATTSLNTAVDINVLSNDVAGATPLNPNTVTFISGTTPNPTTEGVFTVNPTTGLVTFTPVNGFSGTVTVDYQVCDQNALCDIAKITVVINSVAGPDAINDSATTLVDTPVNIFVLSNDVPGATALNPTTVTFITGTEPNPSTVGTFTVSPAGVVTFTPITGFVGEATIDYQVCDLNSLCDIATITVNVILGTGNLYPALGFGTLAYEDLWPGKGDYDFNDLVIDYQFEITSNANNFVLEMIGTFVIKAFGASYENGFGFQLSSAINAADLTVTGYDLTEGFITLDANGTEAGQAKPTIIVYDNSYSQMQHPGIGIGVNTEISAPYVNPVTLTILIKFKPNTYTYNDLDISNFNPFLIINKNRSMEVHLPNYEPTSLADMTVFGTVEDNSNPGNGRYYLTDTNLPWAINIYERFDYPIEKQEILWAHLKFAEWAMSGGVQFPDWYKNLTGYRNNGLIYQIPTAK